LHPPAFNYSLSLRNLLASRMTLYPKETVERPSILMLDRIDLADSELADLSAVANVIVS